VLKATIRKIHRWIFLIVAFNTCSEFFN